MAITRESKGVESPVLFENLMDDAIEHIGSFLDPRTQGRAASACRQLYYLFSPCVSTHIQNMNGHPRDYAGEVASVKISARLHPQNRCLPIVKRDGIELHGGAIAIRAQRFDWNKGKSISYVLIKNSLTTKTLGVFDCQGGSLSNIIALPYGYFAFAKYLHRADKDQTVLILSVGRAGSEKLLKQERLIFSGKFDSLCPLKSGHIAIIAQGGKTEFILKFLAKGNSAIPLALQTSAPASAEEKKLGMVIRSKP